VKKTFTQKFWSNRSRKGFTLVELVMAIAILAVIAAIAIPVVSSVIKSANQNTDRNNAKTVDLLLKEAYTEIQAGISEKYNSTTYPGTDPIAKQVTVATVLQDNGLGNLIKDGKFDYKTLNYDTEDRIVFSVSKDGAIEGRNGDKATSDGWTIIAPTDSLEAICKDYKGTGSLDD